MKSRPVTMVNTAPSTSTPAKRTLFRIALLVAMIGTVTLTTILILQGALILGRLRYFLDIGVQSLNLTSIFLLICGILSLLTFVLLSVGVLKVNKNMVLAAAGLLAVCSLALIAFSIWSFLTITGGNLPASINSTLVKELDQTQYSLASGNNIVIENTPTMAKLEKQHNCCGLTDPIEDYRTRQPNVFNSGHSAPSANTNPSRGRTTTTQRNTGNLGSSVHLPFSCCNEKYRSVDNLCIDMFGNTSNPLQRYNTDGCYPVIARHKFERIERQGFTTIIAACISVISCIALAAVLRLLNEGYQIVPVRTAM